MSEKKSPRKKQPYPIEVRKLKDGYSFRFRLPSEFGGGWVNVGNTKQGCTYKDAVRAYQSMMGDIARRRFKIRDTRYGALFKVFALEYLKYLKAEKGETAYEELYTTHFINHFGSKPLTSITPEDVKSYVDNRLKQVSSGTVRKEFYYLRKIFKEAAKPEWWPVSNLNEDFKNPCVGIKPPPENPPRQKIATEEELKKLLDHSPNQIIRSIILFAIYSGCRQSEILSLREEQVNWESGYIYWKKTKNRKPKNLPLSPVLEKILKEVARPEGNPYFFCSPKIGKPYTKDGFVTIFARMKENAELQDLRFHDLRRVFGTKLAEKGYREKDIAELLGHVDTRSTQIYVEITDKRKREAMESIEFEGLQED